MALGSNDILFRLYTRELVKFLIFYIFTLVVFFEQFRICH